jgi:flagellar motor switch protein FliM
MQDSRANSAAARQATQKLLEVPQLAVSTLPVLQQIFETMATACTESVREMCATPVSFQISSLESSDVHDWLESGADGLTAIYFSPEWDARIGIAIDRRFIFSLVEAVFGGDGNEPQIENPRNYSSIETAISKLLFEHARQSLQESFRNISPTALVFERIETRLDIATLGSRNVPAMVAHLRFEIWDVHGQMSVMIPQNAIYPVRKKLTHGGLSLRQSSDPTWSRKMEEEVSLAHVKLEAILEEREITLGEITAFHIGQILPLDATTSSLVRLECRDEKLFMCKLGQSSGKFTLSVETKIEAGDLASDMLAAAVEL